MTHNERVLDLLSDGKPHSHHEGYGLRVMFHSRVADLRKQGHVIECWRDGENYLYQLTSLCGSALKGGRALPQRVGGNQEPRENGTRAMLAGTPHTPPLSPLREAPSSPAAGSGASRSGVDPKASVDAPPELATSLSPASLQLSLEDVA